MKRQPFSATEPLIPRIDRTIKPLEDRMIRLRKQIIANVPDPAPSKPASAESAVQS